ncbi:MAG: Fic family protein [Desulfovibrio sp.]|nr:Fic family protein [Desulfovibrio sp.]
MSNNASSVTRNIPGRIPLYSSQRSGAVRRTGDADGRTVLLGMNLRTVPPEKQSSVIGHFSADNRIQFRIRADTGRKGKTPLIFQSISYRMFKKCLEINLMELRKIDSEFRNFSFLAGLDNDLRISLLCALRDKWTHTSTALEGNSFTLGDTEFFLKEGITIGGKSLQEHMDIYGHAEAIEYVYDIICNKGNLTEEKLFGIHRLVQKNLVHDVYKPVGAWKVEPNGTYVSESNGGQRYIEYPAPEIIPLLMTRWFDWQKNITANHISRENAPHAFAAIHTSFVRIHPFYDGNGRVARLIANMALLRSGLPPLLIQKEHRKEYIQLLAEYEHEAGAMLMPDNPLLPKNSTFEKIVIFCAEQWKTTWELVDKAHEVQASRDKNSNISYMPRDSEHAGFGR